MVTVRIDEDSKDGKALLDFLKSYSAKTKSVEILVSSSPEMIKEKRPNATTEKIFEETDKGTSLKKFNSVDALFEDLYS